MPDSPFIRDVPAAQALDAWRAAREAAGCPDRLAAITVPVTEAAGMVTAAPVWAIRSSPPFDAAGMDGIAVTAADTLGAGETTPVYLAPGAYDVVDTGDPMPDGRDAVVMREHVHYDAGTSLMNGLSGIQDHGHLTARVKPGRLVWDHDIAVGRGQDRQQRRQAEHRYRHAVADLHLDDVEPPGR